jgi:FMN-dependent NADH-azoreductase
MPNLLHIDNSISGEQSTSRRLSARAARRWSAVHPGGTVTYRDLGLSSSASLRCRDRTCAHDSSGRPQPRTTTLVRP